jgi:thiosulfate reductase cytochrome b subunit
MIAKLDVALETKSQKTVYRKHHLLVRLAHWSNVPILLGLTLTGLSIYWASPVLTVPTRRGQQDIFAIIGQFAIEHISGQTDNARDWFYNHFAFGARNLATNLNLHWFFAYLFMLVALVYLIGLISGGGYRALVPRSTDIAEGLRMVKYYLNAVPAFISRQSNPHPVVKTKYNALQKTAYLSVSLFSLGSILSGWAIHKPVSLAWLQALFGGYDSARVWHFLFMVSFGAFLIPHVVLVILDGWDCFRSMVLGWSDRVKGLKHE